METGQEELKDAELILAYLNGSAGAFECLYKRYRRQLYAYLNQLLEQDQKSVDDVFQLTWLKVIDHLPRYKDQNTFLAFLLHVAHNAAMDNLRKNHRKAQYEVSVNSGDAESREKKSGEKGEEYILPGDERYMPGKDMENREMAIAVEKAVNTLKTELKEVFLLRMEDLSFKEIAKIQKCSINTVLARMQYAVKNLRLILKDWKENL